MSVEPTAEPSASSPDQGMPAWLSFTMAAACGLIVANIYYAQPLIGPIAASLGMSHAAAGLIVTLTQCGYGLGLLLVVPLSDLLENRRLIAGALVFVALGALLAAFAQQPLVLLAACFGIGFFAVAAQVIVPFAAHLSPESQRGAVVGNVMSGLLLGIMFSRPLASLVADQWGWHAIFAISAVATLLMAVLLRAVLPRRVPAVTSSYGALLASMWRLFRDTPLLRLRGLYQAFVFGAFSLFWTVVPLHLAAAPLSLSQTQIALFALAGVAGAIAAPIAGRLADRGWSRVGTPVSMLMVMAGFALTLVPVSGRAASLAVLVAAAIVIDMGVSASLLLGQRAVFALGAQIRGRLNGLFMAMFFVGGALGSSLGAWAYAANGWPLAAALGMLAPALGLGWLVIRGAAQEAALSPA